MSAFSRRIKPYIDSELAAAATAGSAGDYALEFSHLERAHILGQHSTRQHVRVHALMLAWGWRRGNLRECLGQLLRIAGAATQTPFGLVPTGNTGGSNISPFKPLTIPEDLQIIIARAKTGP